MAPRFRIRLPSWLYLTTVLCIRHVSGQASCAQLMQKSLSIVHYNGTSWTCCSQSGDCIQTAVIGGCYSPYSGLTQCVVAGSAKACGINGLPGCGAYVGPIGSYGINAYIGSGIASFDLKGVGQSVLMNWPRVGYDNSVALCCAPTSCRLASVMYLQEDMCYTDEYMLKCAGDIVHGICSVWNSVEIGEYLLVNANFSSSASQPQQPSSSSKTHIIIGVVLAVSVIVIILVTFRLYPRRRKPPGDDNQLELRGGVIGGDIGSQENVNLDGVLPLTPATPGAVGPLAPRAPHVEIRNGQINTILGHQYNIYNVISPDNTSDGRDAAEAPPPVSANA